MPTFTPKPTVSQQAAPARSGTIGRAKFELSREANSISYSQRALGHQTMRRLVEGGAEEFAPVSARSTSFGQDFSRIPVYPPAAESIHTKLTISRSRDDYEQETDRVADQVMSSRSPQSSAVYVSSTSDAASQGKFQPSEQAPTFDRKENGAAPGSAPSIVHEVLGSSGQPLDPATRAFMEPRFAHNFGNVRVYTDQRAARSASAIHALAYTSGERIVFAAGQHSPNTASGRHLLAHELAHVVQQARHPTPMIYRKATKKDEADKIVAVKDHTAQQRLVLRYLSDAVKVKPDSAKGPLDPDNLYRNTAELVHPPKTAKAVLKVLTPTHYSDVNDPTYFDSRVAHDEIKGDYSADPIARDPGTIKPPTAGTRGQTDVFVPQSTGSPITTAPKGEEQGPGRVDPTYTGKEKGMPKGEATEPAKAQTPAKSSTPPVLVWSAAEMKLFLDRAPVPEINFKNTLVHEGQHVADWSYLIEKKAEEERAKRKKPNDVTWEEALEDYKTEFRAFWIQPPVTQPGIGVAPSEGGPFPSPYPLEKQDQDVVTLAAGQDCSVCGGTAPSTKGTATPKTGGTATPKKDAAPTAPSHATKMKNGKQQAIFHQLLDLYKYRHFDCFYVCNDNFRQKVDDYDSPAGINVANSARLIELNVELQRLTPSSTRTEIGQTKFQSAIERLDGVDWSFLTDDKLSKPFWDSAKGFAPTPIYDALKTLAKKGNAAAKDITTTLETALKKLKP